MVHINAQVTSRDYLGKLSKHVTPIVMMLDRGWFDWFGCSPCRWRQRRDSRSSPTQHRIFYDNSSNVREEDGYCETDTVA